MDVTTYSNFRQNLKSHLDDVVNDQKALYVTRANGEDVVVLSKSDYEGLQETYYLMRSPKNAERLMEISPLLSPTGLFCYYPPPNRVV